MRTCLENKKPNDCSLLKIKKVERGSGKRAPACKICGCLVQKKGGKWEYKKHSSPKTPNAVVAFFRGIFKKKKFFLPHE